MHHLDLSISKLLLSGYEVFSPIGRPPEVFDLIAYCDGLFMKIVVLPAYYHKSVGSPEANLRIGCPSRLRDTNDFDFFCIADPGSQRVWLIDSVELTSIPTVYLGKRFDDFLLVGEPISRSSTSKSAFTEAAISLARNIGKEA
jgi:hypothetical protein